jgi:hypothetical protein
MIPRIIANGGAETLVVESPPQQRQRLTRRQRREREEALQCTVRNANHASVMALDDAARVEPLMWCGAPLTHTLAATFSLTEPRTDSAAVHTWAMKTRLLARPTFIVNNFVATRARAGLRLSVDARRMLNTPNAGGASALSEALALDVLSAAYGATLDLTEMQIRYWCTTKITDFSIQLCGVRVGVSVSRACRFRGKFTVEERRAPAAQEAGRRQRVDGARDHAAPVEATDSDDLGAERVDCRHSGVCVREAAHRAQGRHACAGHGRAPGPLDLLW